MKQLYEMNGEGCSIRGIADEQGIARNTVQRYLNSPEAMRSSPGHGDIQTGPPRGIRSTVGCQRGWRIAWCCTGS